MGPYLRSFNLKVTSLILATYVVLGCGLAHGQDSRSLAGKWRF